MYKIILFLLFIVINSLCTSCATKSENLPSDQEVVHNDSSNREKLIYKQEKNLNSHERSHQNNVRETLKVQNSINRGIDAHNARNTKGYYPAASPYPKNW